MSMMKCEEWREVVIWSFSIQDSPSSLRRPTTKSALLPCAFHNLVARMTLVQRVMKDMASTHGWRFPPFDCCPYLKKVKVPDHTAFVLIDFLRFLSNRLILSCFFHKCHQLHGFHHIASILLLLITYQWYFNTHYEPYKRLFIILALLIFDRWCYYYPL